MLELMNKMNGVLCSCGKLHKFDSDVYTGKDAIQNLSLALEKFSSKGVYVICDKNTAAAGLKKTEAILRDAGVKYFVFTYPESPKPDEAGVGAALMNCPKSCDTVIAIGSGVINDIGKVIAAISNKPYIIIATAPSMDGYASATSSVCRSGLKVSINTKSAEVIIGDKDILATAPRKMLASGLGDMLAKYVSICEWRISHIITGEYYCEKIAELIRGAVTSCIEALNKESYADSVEAIFEGLIIGSVAMNYAGISRPASGVEHYISHVIDMRAEEFGSPEELHGIQCAAGTYIAVKIYQRLKDYTPKREVGEAYAEGFDIEDWNSRLRALLGKGAESMIELEKKERKYDTERHKARLSTIIAEWDNVVKIINEELPPICELDKLYSSLELPRSVSELGTDEKLFPEIFRATKDIRDKYVLSRLLFDIGVIDEFLNQ